MFKDKKSEILKIKSASWKVLNLWIYNCFPILKFVYRRQLNTGGFEVSTTQFFKLNTGPWTLAAGSQITLECANSAEHRETSLLNVKTSFSRWALHSHQSARWRSNFQMNNNKQKTFLSGGEPVQQELSGLHICIKQHSFCPNNTANPYELICGKI